MRYFSIDLETTGLKGEIHGITEFACVLGDTNQPQLCKSFYRWIDPDGYVWSRYCLTLHAAWIKDVCDRIRNNQLEAESAVIPKICKSIGEVMFDFAAWLTQVGETEPLRVTATGKNFASFDKTFLAPWSMFRHRMMEWVPFYTSYEDKVPPELSLCKARALAAGCKLFSNAAVAHNALDDAMDVHHLIQFAAETDNDVLRMANNKVKQ